MPNREFLEKYPLYRRFKFTIPATLDLLPVTAVHMRCESCASEQTFVKVNDYWEDFSYENPPAKGVMLRLRYLCTSCQKFGRDFLVKLDEDGKFIMKVGQYPAWDISGDANVESLLGDSANYFKRGLICESQSYGIAAFAYYRRIVEEIIDQLLDDIADLLAGDELDLYKEALAKTKETRVASEKIDLVKDLLPPILRPGGMNPLGTLHQVLSEGLHAESDERCMELAMAVREVLVFLASQVASSRSAGRSFTDRMKQLLEQKGGGAA